MPIMGFKNKFKNIEFIRDVIFTINFNLKYTDYGGLKIDDENDNYFDVGNFRILINDCFNEFDEELLKRYDNGVLILSICKYLVDKIPGLYSIVGESDGMIDTYYKEEIIKDYEKIKNRSLI